MGSERADFYATLDLKAVEASLKQARAEIDSTITANGRLDASLGRVEGAVGKMRKGLGPAMGAMNGLTAAMGESTGAMSKAVGGASSLANAWMQGGPMMAAIAGLGVALTMLQKHWEDVNKAQDEAITKEFAVVDKASKMAADRRAKLVEERDRLAIASSVGDDKSMLEFAMSLREQMVAANKLMESTDEHIRSIGKGARKEIDELIALRAETMRVEKAAGKGKGKGKDNWLLEEPSGYVPDEFDKAMDERYAKERAADQLERDLREHEQEIALKALRDHERDVLAAKKVGAQAADALRMDEIQKEQDKLEMIRKGYQSLYTDWMPGALNNGLGAFQGFIDGVIEGDEYAAQKATAAFMKSTGNQLVGIGTKALFEGAAMNAGVPGSGIPMMVVGGAAIAAGVGMGAGATAISVGVGKAEATRDEAAQAAEDRAKERAKEREKAAKERGTGGRSPRGPGDSGGGGVTIVNQWGVAGPTADEQARAMRRVVDRMNDGRF